MIRPAEESDLDEIVRMAPAFLAHHPGNLGTMDAEGVRSVLRQLRLEGVVLIARDTADVAVGFLVGAVNHAWFDIQARRRYAVELAWWIEPAARGGAAGLRLLLAFEEWARSVEADAVVLSDLVVDGRPSIGDMADRLGYALIERSHSKELG